MDTELWLGRPKYSKYKKFGSTKWFTKNLVTGIKVWFLEPHTYVFNLNRSFFLRAYDIDGLVTIPLVYKLTILQGEGEISPFL